MIPRLATLYIMIRHCFLLTGRLHAVAGRNFVSKSCVVQAKIVELVPALGESITEGSIAKWSKNVGDHVAVDDVVVIVETDKVTVDIKSTNAGVLTAQLATDTVSHLICSWNSIFPSFQFNDH